MATKLTKKQQTQLTEKLTGIIQKNNALQLRLSADRSVNEMNVNQISGELNRIHSKAIGKEEPPAVITFAPKQEGSGDPSPTNIRPISGYEIEGIGTVYGGELVVVSGTLKVTWGIVDLGTLTWTHESDNKQFYSNIFESGYSGWMYNVICSEYVQDNRVYAVVASPHVRGINNNRVYIVDASYSDAATFKTAMSGVMLAYELATPAEYTLTMRQMLQLLDQL